MQAIKLVNNFHHVAHKTMYKLVVGVADVPLQPRLGKLSGAIGLQIKRCMDERK